MWVALKVRRRETQESISLTKFGNLIISEVIVNPIGLLFQLIRVKKLNKSGFQNKYQIFSFLIKIWPILIILNISDKKYSGNFGFSYFGL